MDLERLNGALESRDTTPIGTGCVFVGCNADGADDMDDLGDVIEDDDLLVEAEVQVREVAIIGRCTRPWELLGLGVADGVVRGESDPPSEHASREPPAGLILRHDEAPAASEGAEGFYRIIHALTPLDRLGCAPIGDDHVVLDGSHLDRGMCTDERVASLSVAILDGLEEEGWSSTGILDDQASVGENGRELVAEQAGANGYDDGAAATLGTGYVDDGGELLDCEVQSHEGASVEHVRVSYSYVMRRHRAAMPEPRLELTPLIDTVFLLLTFFLFALVLTARIEVTDIDLPGAAVAETPDPGVYAVVEVQRDGTYLLESTTVSLEEAVTRLSEKLEEEPSTTIVVAPDRATSAEALLTLLDALSAAELRAVRILRKGNEGGGSATP